jgi:hypothetical protein
MPFMRWNGPYAIHGPIDNYRAANGGTLRRGYVSHGCIRMESAGILEVYARLRGVAKVPVHVQREIERRPDGTRVDVEQKFIGSECERDDDCNFEGGLCETNEVGGRGYCTMTCTTSCPDKGPYPATFCADLGHADGGRCLPKASAVNYDCRPYDHMQPTSVHRPAGAEQSASAKVCAPGTRGFIGDRCLDADDCEAGYACTEVTPGSDLKFCTDSCTGTCDDEPGAPGTACMDDFAGEGSTCVRLCSPQENGCPAGFDCDEHLRADGQVRHACVPGFAEQD